MSPALKWRFRAEVAGALTCAAVFLATLVEPRWFELLFDEAPDGGDGSLEAWVALACSLLLGFLLAGLARRDWRAGKAATTP
jgi:glutathione S-transferase